MHTIKIEAALTGLDYALSGPAHNTIAHGCIQTITPADVTSGAANASTVATEGEAPRRLLAIPAPVDAHNHARPLSTTSFGCGGKPLETWLPQLAVMPPVDVYTTTAASLARSLRGCATSLMVHMVRPMGLTALAHEAREVARAAQDVGASVGYAIGMRDRNPLVCGDAAPLLDGLEASQRALVEATWLAPMPSIDEQLAAVDTVAEAVASVDGPMNVDVQYGPAGVQWCTGELLQATAEASLRTGRRVHMHLLETRPQRAWADVAYPDGIVTMLGDIGLLSNRLTPAHRVWARDDELRLFCHLNHTPGFDTTGLTPQSALRAASATGRAALGQGEGGALASGMPTDLLLLDLESLDRDALMAVDARDYLFARATKEHIVEIFSAGRHVMADGRLTGVDLGKLEVDLREMVRAGLVSKEPLRALWPALEGAIAEHYQGCC